MPLALVMGWPTALSAGQIPTAVRTSALPAQVSGLPVTGLRHLLPSLRAVALRPLSVGLKGLTSAPVPRVPSTELTASAPVPTLAPGASLAAGCKAPPAAQGLLEDAPHPAVSAEMPYSPRGISLEGLRQSAAASVYDSGRLFDGGRETAPFGERLLIEMGARHTARENPPAFVEKLDTSDRDWIRETVRTEGDSAPERLHENPEFRNYLAHVAAAWKDFDVRFRKGLVSGNLRKALKAGHAIMVNGGGKKQAYVGTTASPEERFELIDPRLFAHEIPRMVIQTATILLKDWASEWNGRDEWTGPGRELQPPPYLEGPFPANGETWELWFQEIVDAPEAKRWDPRSTMPKNWGVGSRVLHRYPPFFTQPLYLDRMSQIMGHIENCLLRTHPNTPLRDVIILIADYYQVGINAHLFARVNNSLLMAQVNYLLHFAGLRGIAHGALDYYALYKVPADFRAIFVRAVLERNPGLEPR